MSDDEVLTPENIDTPPDAESYTPSEVCALFRVSPRTVVRWERDGKLEKYGVRVYRTIGRHRRFNKEDINRMYYELNPKPEDE
jgi:excisionase family DNA binding protein